MSNEELVVPDSLLQVSAAAHQSEQKVVFSGEKAKGRVHECAGDRYRQCVGDKLYVCFWTISKCTLALSILDNSLFDELK